MISFCQAEDKTALVNPFLSWLLTLELIETIRLYGSTSSLAQSRHRRLRVTAGCGSRWLHDKEAT
jgi:hypothetical protein